MLNIFHIIRDKVTEAINYEAEIRSNETDFGWRMSTPDTGIYTYVQEKDMPWCNKGTIWHYDPHESSVGVGSYVPAEWREDMQCGMPSPFIREWEMKQLIKEGWFSPCNCKCKCHSCK